METKTCTMCIIEKDFNNFYTKFSECKNCNWKRAFWMPLWNQDEISNQSKVYY